MWIRHNDINHCRHRRARTHQHHQSCRHSREQKNTTHDDVIQCTRTSDHSLRSSPGSKSCECQNHKRNSEMGKLETPTNRRACDMAIWRTSETWQLSRPHPSTKAKLYLSNDGIDNGRNHDVFRLRCRGRSRERKAWSGVWKEEESVFSRIMGSKVGERWPACGMERRAGRHF